MCSGRARTRNTGGDDPQSPDFNIISKPIRDKGSSKKTKKRRKEVIDTIDEHEEFIEQDKLTMGFERETSFRSGEKRHMFYNESVKGMLKEYNLTKSRPGLLAATDAFQNSLNARKLRKRNCTVGGVPWKQTAADFAFISLPTNLRVRRQDLNVPPWNVWDDETPSTFFTAMTTALDDKGFAGVLSVGDNFHHRRKIFEAAERKGRFKIAQSYSVILSSPLYNTGSDLEVIFPRIYG